VHDGKILNFAPNPNYPEIPSLNPSFLLLHNSVARVLKISGRGEVLEKTWREWKTVKELANDGSSGDLLRNILLLLEFQLAEDSSHYETLDEDSSTSDRLTCLRLTK